jgi:hypothetical protein
MTGRTDVTTDTRRPRNGQRRAPGAAVPGDGRPRTPAGRGPYPPAGTGQPVRARRPAGVAGHPAGRQGLRRPAPATPGLAARPATPAPRPQVLRAAEPARASRTRFVFLVLGLLGGGLLCLLLINTILAAGSFQITALQQGNLRLSQQEQDLHVKIAAEEAPSSLAGRARKLGMVEPGLLHFLNIKTGRVNSGPATMAGIPTVPGYTP